MSRDEALKVLMEGAETSDLVRKVDELTEKVNLLLSAIVIKQVDACNLAGVHRDTALNKARAGDIKMLTGDGSSLNFIQLKEIGKLKSRTRTKRRRK